MGVNAPFAGALAFGVDGHHDALAAEGLGAGIDQFRVVDRGGVDADLVRAGQQHFAHVFHGPDAAAHGQRDETMLGGAADHVHHRVALVG